jgi:hypothetical protein
MFEASMVPPSAPPADDRVHLVDEEDHVPRPGRFLHDLLQALLEFGPVLRPPPTTEARSRASTRLPASTSGTSWETMHRASPLDDGGLADPRLPDEDGIVSWFRRARMADDPGRFPCSRPITGSTRVFPGRGRSCPWRTRPGEGRLFTGIRSPRGRGRAERLSRDFPLSFVGFWDGSGGDGPRSCSRSAGPPAGGTRPAAEKAAGAELFPRRRRSGGEVAAADGAVFLRAAATITGARPDVVVGHGAASSGRIPSIVPGAPGGRKRREDEAGPSSSAFPPSSSSRKSR